MLLTDQTYYLLDNDFTLSIIFQTDSLEEIADSWLDFELAQLEEL